MAKAAKAEVKSKSKSKDEPKKKAKVIPITKGKKSKEEDAPKSKGKAKVVPIKDKKDMSPLEKARLARANGTSKKSKSKKKVLPTFKAPEDFKPHFLEVLIKTEKDGLLSSLIKATRYQGRYDPNVDDKKKADLGSYDPRTLAAILSRLSMTSYVTNPVKRLPPNTTFKVLLRITKKSKDGTIGAAFKEIWIAKKNEKSGKIKAVSLDKKDPMYRLIRKASRILPAAFKDVLMPPKKVRGQKVKKEDEDD